MVHDYTLALERYRAKADAGDSESQYRLGVMFGLGLGVAQDYARAVRWYREAAERGHSRAQSNLGFMYGTGRGVPQDYVLAYAWYSIAAAGGEEAARHNRDTVADRMSATQLEQAQRVASDLFEKIDASRPDAG